MTLVRGLAAFALIALALVLQVSFFSELAWHGVVPDLVLLVVVAGALARGGQFGMLLGFAAGVLLDLTPPADHTAGRWALALLLVGFVAGTVRANPAVGGAGERRLPALTVMAVVAGCSFVGTSVFALSGFIVGEPIGSFGATFEAIGVSLLWDVLLAPVVLPLVMALFRRFEPERAAAR